MATITAENLARCKRAMGDELGTAYCEICSRHTWLLLKWAEYVELYGTSPERIGLLNASAPHLFYVVQEAIWADTLLDLAKLTDAPSIGRWEKRATLTIRRLPDLVDLSIRPKVAHAVDAALSSVEFARDWRNRTLAHLDLELITKGGAEPLKPASRAAVKAALYAIEGVLAILETHYFQKADYRDDRTGDSALGLLYLLREARQARDARGARISAGKATPDDLEALTEAQRRPL